MVELVGGGSVINDISREFDDDAFVSNGSIFNNKKKKLCQLSWQKLWEHKQFKVGKQGTVGHLVK